VRRKRRRGPIASLDVDPASRSSDLEQHFRFEHLYQSLDRLDAEEARVVSLKHFQNMTFEEISARTQISENTLKTRYYRGLRKLRHFLTRQDEEELP
jgi:RNA polymerase sigma factor (sigma-70 family)